MKFNMEVFKKGKPIYWIIGAIVIFVIFYKIASGPSASSKAASTSGGVTTINTGPSDAQIAAAAGISAAQIQANAQVAGAQLAFAAQKDANAAGVAVSQLEAQAHMYDTAMSADTAKFLAAQEGQIAMAGITAQQNIAFSNNEYSFATARVAAETSLAMTKIQADMVNNGYATQLAMAKDQNATTIALGEQQRRAYTTAALVSGINSAPAVDRDNMLALIAATSSGQSITYHDSGSGSFTLQ